MNITEITNISNTLRKLWADFFPHSKTPPANIAQALANKDWIRDTLVYYGWPAIDGKLDINIIFIDTGGAVLYHNTSTPCALISIEWSGNVPSLKFTYVDNRPQ